MIVKILENLNKDNVLVFVLKENNLIKNHPFWNLLNAYDQNFILNFLKKNKVNSSSVYNLFLPSNRELILIGETKKEKFNHRKALILARKIIYYARTIKKRNLIICFNDFKNNDLISDLDLATILGIQLEIANFEFIDYKTSTKNNNFFIEEIQIVIDKNLNKKLFNEYLLKGQIVGQEINEARRLSNIPGGDMTPKKLAEFAKKTFSNSNVKVKILNERQIEKIGMGGILGVSRGSSEKPYFIIIEYFGNKKDNEQIVLVGKGVTFDTGGLNLKSSDNIYEMHMDMSGGASVIHAISALSKLKINKNIIGLIPAVENMPSGSSYRPGDLLKTLSGKTIEVLNTDAEGRIILADTLTYAQKFYHPKLIIDLATLTGAAMVALGQRASAVFSNNENLIHKIQKAGEETGDFVWPLPLWEEYEKDILGTFGDVANVSKTRYGGAIAGAMFLYQFIKNENNEIQWAHLDIAPRMTTIEGDYLAKGSAGPGVALIFWLISKFL